MPKRWQLLLRMGERGPIRSSNCQRFGIFSGQLAAFLHSRGASRLVPAHLGAHLTKKNHQIDGITCGFVVKVVVVLNLPAIIRNHLPNRRNNMRIRDQKSERLRAARQYQKPPAYNTAKAVIR